MLNKYIKLSRPIMMTGRLGIGAESTVFCDFYHRLYDLNKPENQNKELADAASTEDFVRVVKRSIE